jgi:hypothetical protein
MRNHVRAVKLIDTKNVGVVKFNNSKHVNVEYYEGDDGAWLLCCYPAVPL